MGCFEPENRASKRLKTRYAGSSKVYKRSSLADFEAYTACTERAAINDHAFANFKRDKCSTEILEHVTADQGRQYLDIVLKDNPAILQHLDQFRENDRYGNPITSNYGPYGEFSPTTLRYLKVLSDLLTIHGDLSNMNIIEIGGGYGGQANVISRFCGFRSYAIVDLKPCLGLARRYLDINKVKNVKYLQMDELAEDASYDLLISNYAFSECTRGIQETYFKKALSRTKRAYLTCNNINPKYFNSFGKQDYLDRLRGSRILEEIPITHPDNYIVVW